MAIVFFAALFCMSPYANAEILRVDRSGGSCAGNGNGWGSNAFLYLQDALTAAVTGDQIWVAQGEYFVDQRCSDPDGTGERNETFELKRGVLLRGGFAGTELVIEDRILTGFETILSGVLGRPDEVEPCGSGGSCFDGEEFDPPGCNDTLCCEIVCDIEPTCCDTSWDEGCAELAVLSCGEAYHVVTAGILIDDPELTFIERFTIQDGVANGPGLHEKEGGGMLVLGKPGIIRCDFTKNVATDRGNGMSINGDGIRPRIVNCTFYENPPVTTPFVIGDGGGLASFNANPQLTNCLFYDDIIPRDGGAVHNEIGTCSAGDCGEMDLINCTIVDNVASDGNSNGLGGGVFNTGGAFVDAENCIFFDNIDKDGQIESSQIYDTTASFVTFSMIEGCSGTGFCEFPGDGNITGPPTYGTGFRLILASNGVDEGNPVGPLAGVPSDNYDVNQDGDTAEATPDLDQSQRISGADADNFCMVIDMGAYEIDQGDICCPWDLDDVAQWEPRICSYY